MDILLYIAGGIAAIVLILVIVVALQPSEFRLTRKTGIAAPPATVFAQVNDFHKWQAWSPWEKLDPALQRTYDGPEAGTGAGYAWTGNDQVGQGRMTITESRPSELIRIKLEFIKPFQATNNTEFTFTPDASGTVVTWSMTGENGFVAKAFHMLMNMEKMVGGDFEKGLASMKAVAESAK